MPRICTVCSHAEREAIDRALVDGSSFREIAGRFGTTKSALDRHKQTHLAQSIVKAHQASEVARADTLLDQVKGLQAKALGILSKAEESGDLRAATGAIREARQTMELVAKMVGELDERPTINVLMTPDWQQLRSLLLQTLDPFPRARKTVVAALEGADNARE